MSEYHIPVLLQSACDFLQVKPDGKYIDATLGGGGHALEIIHRGGQVLGLDQDPDALASVPKSPRLTVRKTNFIHLREVSNSEGWSSVDGIIFDLGVSWHQIDTPSRGFSFQNTGPLDMRMDPELPNSADTLINSLPEDQISLILRDFGELSNSRSLAQKIIASRPIHTTGELAKIFSDQNIVRKVFQALRITVNDELGALSMVLPQALDLLNPSGRLVIISFHSLEDQIVKKQFIGWSKNQFGLIVTPSPIVPAADEIRDNPRSKSAKLRVFQKN